MISAKHKNICVVGDDDQSIYSWRGAKPKNIINFDKNYRGATVIRLEENYRSVNSVLKASNALISNNEDRVGKTLWSSKGEGEPFYVIAAEDGSEEAERVVGKIKRAVKENGSGFSNHAILFRTNGQTRIFEEELRVERLPYVVIGGQSFFDQKEVRDMLAFLSVISNPDDENSLLRIINVPARSLGSKSIERLVSFSIEKRMPLFEALGRADEIKELNAGAKKGAESLYNALSRGRKMAEDKNFSGLVSELIKDINYQAEVEHLFDDPLTISSRVSSAYEVGDSLSEYANRNSGADLSSFLQDTALFGREQDSDKDKELAKNAIKLITLHSSKGLEFPHVYLVGMQEGILPHKNSVDMGDISEERRLAYVGITRAQLSLTLSYSKTVTSRGKTSKIKPSRFFEEIPQELLDYSDRKVQQEKVLSHIEAIRAALEK
jgi:superfamily I DNA/RNA helicase